MNYPTSMAALTVWVTDDDKVSRTMLAHTLAVLGLRPLLLQSGEAALLELEKRTVDVLLLDLQMPGIGGIEVTRRIRLQNQDPLHPWIIAITAEAYPEAREECFQVGINDLLVKPIDKEALYQALERAHRRWLSNRTDSACHEYSDPLPSESQNAIGFKENLPRPELICVSKLLEHSLGDQKNGRRLLEIFFQNFLPGITEMRGALSSGDHKLLAALVHRWKGSAAVVGAGLLQQELGNLSTILKKSPKAVAWELEHQMEQIETIGQRTQEAFRDLF